MPPFVIGSLVLSTLILIGVYVGVALRRDRKKHIPIMLTCGVLDVGLVFAIVAYRQALDTAMAAEGTILRVHLAFSVPALLCWFVAFASGPMRKKGRWTRVHRWNAMIFLVARTGNWITSFFLDYS